MRSFADRRFSRWSTGGLRGQFAIGLLLGLVWVPCTGPTLGATSLLAARGEDLLGVGMVMLAFGLGAAAPLVFVGVVSRAVLFRSGERLLTAAKTVKAALGVLLAGMGLAILTGLDKIIETRFVDASPLWLTQLTTRF